MKIRRCARVLAGRLHRKTCPRGRGRTIFGGVINEFAELAGETMKIRGTRWHLVPRFRRSHSRVRRTRPETMKIRGTRWHLVPRFRRRNDENSWDKMASCPTFSEEARSCKDQDAKSMTRLLSAPAPRAAGRRKYSPNAE